MLSADRRIFLKNMGVMAGGLVLLPYMSACSSSQPVADETPKEEPEPSGPVDHTLPELAYGYDALAPNIDAMTMEIHHSKHHAGYVSNLNKALEGHDDLRSLGLAALLANGLAAVPEDKRTAVLNNGGGHLNHSLFWKMMTPNSAGPNGAVADAIMKKFGSFDAFKGEFKKTALGQFGSGWGWLVKSSTGELELVGTPEQGNPWVDGKVPVLGIDVWEHAYYLNYENRRGDYIDAFFNVVNWDYANSLFAADQDTWASLI
jgi:Fe-Mn family superoxide dismutase